MAVSQAAVVREGFMYSVRKICTSVFVILSLVCAGNVAGADIDQALTMCVNCHGEDGLGTESDIPIIAGIPAVIQEDAMFAYLDGARNCGNKPLMCGIVSRLSEDQIIELAEHFAAMPYVPAGEEFDAALAEQGRAIHGESCAICHGDDPAAAESSILHGQHKDYLRYALHQYAAGEREQLPAMEEKTSALSPEDIEALLNYYASYRD
jgi:sulfide dehydrogenase cytochrome subunit